MALRILFMAVAFGAARLAAQDSGWGPGVSGGLTVPLHARHLTAPEIGVEATLMRRRFPDVRSGLAAGYAGLGWRTRTLSYTDAGVDVTERWRTHSALWYAGLAADGVPARVTSISWSARAGVALWRVGESVQMDRASGTDQRTSTHTRSAGLYAAVGLTRAVGRVAVASRLAGGVFAEDGFVSLLSLSVSTPVH